MPRIELYQLLRSTTTPEQANLLEHFYRQFDNRSAVNRRIIDVNPLYYQGVIAGTEFLVYDATKLYICYELAASYSVSDCVLVSGIVFFYNEGNVISFSVSNNQPVYNPVVLNYIILPDFIKNIYFSRVAFTNYNYVKFNGFRVTLV